MRFQFFNREEIRKTLRDWQAIAMLVAFVGLLIFTLSYKMVLDTDSKQIIILLDLIASFIGITLIILFKDTKTLKVFLTFLLISRITLILVIAFSADINQAINSLDSQSWMHDFIKDENALRLTIQLGIGVALTVFCLLFVITFFWSLVEARVEIKARGTWKFAISTGSFALLTVAMYFLFSSAKNIQDFIATNEYKIGLFGDSKIGNKFIGLIGTLSFFTWLPLLLKMSKAKKVNVLPSCQFNLSYAIKISFVVHMQYFINKIGVYGKVTSSVLICLVAIAAIYDTYFIMRTLIQNWKIKNFAQPMYVFDWELKTNMFIREK